MTRFARAKGSKSSNERAPEDSTPWEVMKEQLIQSKRDTENVKKREEIEKQRIENYQNFLNDQKVQKKKSTWCDFPETEKVHNNEPAKKKMKKNMTLNTSPQEENTNKPKKEKKKNKNINPTTSNPESSSTEGKNLIVEDTGVSKKKKKSKSKIMPEETVQQSDKSNVSEEVLSTPIKHTNTKPNKHNKKKPKAFPDGKPVRRKELNDRSFQLIINGKDVELVRYDGFPVMKKDADRLEELKNNMIKKGIPKSEVQRTMKLERRRAEKALARLKRDVCYNCRKGGHNLSDCPELKSKIPGVDAADGVCFKCGSTEHKQFDCKVQKDKVYKFATCFICKEPGHIARQCPDNPKGLYPNGGGCKLCGDVTHLRKDCPTIHDKKEESSIKLQTLDCENNIEEIGQQNTSTVAGTSKKPKKIKF